MHTDTFDCIRYRSSFMGHPLKLTDDTESKLFHDLCLRFSNYGADISRRAIPRSWHLVVALLPDFVLP